MLLCAYQKRKIKNKINWLSIPKTYSPSEINSSEALLTQPWMLLAFHTTVTLCLQEYGSIAS